MEKFKSFWTDIFTAWNSEESIAILVFLSIAFLLGLIFGAWSRAGKINRLKKEKAKAEEELKSLRTQYDTLVEQFEKKEEELRDSEVKVGEMNNNITRLTNERNNYQTELRSARTQMERLQEENLAYAAKAADAELVTVGDEVVVIEDVDTTTSSPNTGIGGGLGIANGDEIGGGATGDGKKEHDVQHEMYDDRLALIEEKLERLVLENANLKEEVSTLERGALAVGGAGVLVGGGIAASGETDTGSTVTNVETGEAVLDLSEVEVEDAPPTYENEVLEEDYGNLSPQERAERAKANINKMLGKKIPKASREDKDDLQQLEGIGPFIEMKLNDIGLYTYEQISMLDEEAISLITDAIQFFPGRIEKDNWVGQAGGMMADG